MATHDNHRGAQLFGLTGDDFGEVRAAGHNESTIPRRELLAFCESAKVLPSITLQQSIEIKTSASRRIDQFGR